MLFLSLLGCFTPFTPAVSSGRWKEADYQIDASGCSLNSVFRNDLYLSYEFGEDTVNDTGYGYYGSDTTALQTYVNNIWGLCGNYGRTSPRFDCNVSLLLTQFDHWKQALPFYERVTSGECSIYIDYSYAEGLFIDDTTIKMVNHLEMSCVNDSNDSYQVLQFCKADISSTWTKQ